MSMYKDIIGNGLWKQNPGVVQLLGLCPTLAVTTTVINGLSLGVVTALVMAASNASISPIRRWIPEEVRIPIFVLVIAVLVTLIDLGMNAFAHPLHKVLGIFIPLIVTNCIVLARIEAFAAKNSPAPSTLDGLMMGLGLAMVLTLLGGLRELVGKGTLFSDFDLAFGPAAKALTLNVIPDYPGFLLAVLPPGAFIALGLLIASRNWIEQRRSATESLPPLSVAQSH